MKKIAPFFVLILWLAPLYCWLSTNPIRADSVSQDTQLQMGFTGTYQPPEDQNQDQQVKPPKTAFPKSQSFLPQTGIASTAPLLFSGMSLLLLAFGLTFQKIRHEKR